MPGASPRTPAWTHPALAAALLTLLLHLSSVRFGFVWDDLRLVSLNPMLHSWAGVWRSLTSDFWVSTGNNSSGLWRPLVTASYALDGVLFRWHAWGFHLVNVLVAAGVSALVAALALQSGANRWAATAGGLWFAAMPHHVESVAWIAGRTDLHASLFFLLALLLDRRADRAGARGPGWAALAALAAALLAKESCAAFVVVAFAAHAAAGPARPWRASARWVVPYLALTLAWLVVHMLTVHTPPPPAYLSPDMVRRGQFAAWLMLPGFLGFLWPLAIHTPATILRLPTSLADPGVLLGIALQAASALGLAALTLRRSRWAPPFWIAWATVLPTIAANLFQAYLLYSERFMYLPSAGLAWALALALSPWLARPATRLVTASAALVWIGLCAFTTVRLLPEWRNEDTLYTSMTRKGPRNAQGWILLARLRLSQNRDAECEAALAPVERIAEARPEAFSVRALLFYHRGNWPKVLEYSERAIALDPTLVEPRLARATALLRMGRAAAASQAIAELAAALPDNATVMSLEGQRLLAMRRPDQALPYLERASHWVRDDADLWYALGMASAMLDQVPSARRAFAEAVRADPTMYEGWLKLATACQLLGQESARDSALAGAAACSEAGDGRALALGARLRTMPH